MQKGFHIVNGDLVPSEFADARVQIFVSPDADSRQFIKDTYGLDEHDIASALDSDEVSRIEPVSSGVLLVWKRPKHATVAKETLAFDIGSVGLVLTSDRLALIQETDSPMFSHRKTSQLNSPNDVFLRYLQSTVHHFLGHLKALRMVSRELEIKLNKSMENKVFLQMFAMSESLVYYVDALESNGAALARLRSMAERLGMNADQIALLDDIIIDNRQCKRQAEIMVSVMSGLMDARGNIINNNMNVLPKNLTLLNVAFLPINVIAGIGGMSEFSMMTAGIHWTISYGVFIVVMVLLGVALWFGLKRFVDRPRGE